MANQTTPQTVPLWQQFQRKCIHYNGILGPGMVRHLTCKAGVAYADVTDDQRRNPCHSTDFNGDPCSCTIVCPSAEFLTEEQAKAKEAAARDRLRQRFADIEAGICPHHKRPITLRQVGRCVYAEPCGCRLYQGTLPKK